MLKDVLTNHSAGRELAKLMRMELPKSPQTGGPILAVFCGALHFFLHLDAGLVETVVAPGGTDGNLGVECVVDLMGLVLKSVPLRVELVVQLVPDLNYVRPLQIPSGVSRSP